MEEKPNKIHLSDIAGYEEEKEEARKLIDILANFKDYQSAGASVPKGLLLSGEPGVGKTMFAKAIATEANVPLFEFEADESAEQDEVIKGLKQLFTLVKESVPSIVFIDELDELVSSTEDGGYYGFQSDYSRKALKTLLTEIDGISSSEGVLVIATSNSKRSVPGSLKRSGRLEKHISFRLPSADDRAAIAKLYLDKANIKDVNPNAIAAKTADFSGADIKTLINSAIIESVRSKKPIDINLIAAIIPTIRYGEIKKANKEGPNEAVCYHEIGHFLAQYGLNGLIGTISVENYGTIEGMMEVETDMTDPFYVKRNNMSVDGLLDSVVVCLGGIAGEDIFLGKRYCGSRGDVSNAVDIVKDVLQNGCLGFEYLPNLEVARRTMGGYMTQSEPNRYYAPERHQKIIEILDEKLEKAKAIVQSLKPLGEIIFPLLMDNVRLSKEELTTIVKNYQKGYYAVSAS